MVGAINRVAGQRMVPVVGQRICSGGISLIGKLCLLCTESHRAATHELPVGDAHAGPPAARPSMPLKSDEYRRSTAATLHGHKRKDYVRKSIPIQNFELEINTT
jgi:hypothetical protein